MFSENYRRPIFILICNQSGKIIGGAAVSEEFFTVDVWGISWVSVHPAYRNKGLGQKLMEHCMQEISNRAGKTVSVILATYPNKTRLYERLSFVKAGQDHEGGYFMTKILPFNP
jgi:ribosomal protein S18 acetylase RimI-like enzyme